MTTETELACIGRDAQAGLAGLGLSLAELEQLTTAGRKSTLTTRCVFNLNPCCRVLASTAKHRSINLDSANLAHWSRRRMSPGLLRPVH